MLAIGVKSFLRPDDLARFLASCSVLPDSPIYQETETDNLSKGRNTIVSEVKEDFVLMCDDDFELKECDYQKITELMDKYGMDIVGGSLITNGLLRGLNEDFIDHVDAKCPEREPIKDGFDFQRCDLILNFFIARTSIFQQIRWDENCEIGTEHWDFFLTARKLGLKVYHCPQLIGVHHRTEPTGEYAEYRLREDSFPYYDEKWRNEWQ